MRKWICLPLIALLPSLALAAENPDWAYPVAPPPSQPDNVILKSVPGSAKQYTQAQIDDPFNPPDWFPSEHPPMPEIVAHGGQKPAGRACALCHLPSGDGHPESSSLAGLPAAYLGSLAP
jgi:cytochrome c553